MALHKTAFTDKLRDLLKQSKPNVSMLTEEAWALAKRDVLAWDSLPASERRSWRIYRNHHRYQVVMIGERADLTLRDNAEGMSQEQLALASHTGVFFDQ
eukprot:jgi/Tetstr1/458769/TSEL_045153.t1